MKDTKTIIEQAYSAFNNRDIDGAYATRFSARSPLNPRRSRSMAGRISAWWSTIRRRRRTPNESSHCWP